MVAVCSLTTAYRAFRQSFDLTEIVDKGLFTAHELQFANSTYQIEISGARPTLLIIQGGQKIEATGS